MDREKREDALSIETGLKDDLAEEAEKDGPIARQYLGISQIQIGCHHCTTEYYAATKC